MTQGMRSVRTRLAGIIIGSLLAVAVNASAQERFDVQQFHPMPAQTVNHFAVGSALVLEHLDWEAGLILNWADDPLVLHSEYQDRVLSIVSGQLTMDILGAVGLFNWLELGVDIPVILLQQGEEAPPPIHYTATGDFGLGDIRLVPRLLLYSAESDADPRGVSIGLMGNFFFPTGDSEAFQGEGLRIEPRLAFDYAFGTAARLSANVGYLIRPANDFVNVEVNDTVTFGLGAAFRLAKQFFLVPEVHGEASVLADEIDAEEVPLEVTLGMKAFPIESLLVEAGAGMGLIEGFGTPDWRIFVGLAFSPPPVRDTDGDGYDDPDDGCPLDPEDFDGFEDANGCPDPDNDQDGILDIDDSCPMEPEDIDGFEDRDGCPDPDNDRDGIRDVDDDCPMEPEDIDGFEDRNGCPDPDNDQDGILDVDDACMNVPETVNDFEDSDGCPDTLPLPEVIPCDRISLRGKVHFDFDSDQLQQRSNELLDQVVAIMRERPVILQVRVEGHTDSQGSDRYNMGLSNRRASSVMRYLIDHGIERSRLVPVGYGESRPTATNDTEEGRAENRRVEFIVLEQEGCEDIVPPY